MSVRQRLVLGLSLLALVASFPSATPAAAPAAATISVSGTLVALTSGLTGPPATVSLSQPAASELTLQITLSGEGAPGSSVSTPNLTFGPGESQKTYTLTAGSNLGSLQISYTLAGADAGSYTAPAAHSVAIVAAMQIGPPLPPTMTTGQTYDAQVGLGQTPIDGDLTVTAVLSGTAAAGSSVTPSVLVFDTNDSFKPFTITAGPNAGTLNVQFIATGTASAKHAPPAPQPIEIVAAPTPVGTITVNGGVGMLLNGVTTDPPFTLHLSQPVTSDLAVQVVLTGEGAPGSSVSPETIIFGPGQTSRPYTIMAGHNLGYLQIHYLLSGTDAANYTPPAPHVFAIKAPMQVGQGLPETMHVGTSVQGQVNAGQLPVQGALNITMSLSGPAAAGSSITPSVVTLQDMVGFGAFTVTAGPHTGPLTIEFSASGPGAEKNMAPPPYTINVTEPALPAAMSALPPGLQQGVPSSPITVTLPTPVTTSLVLTPVLEGSAAATTTFSPSTLVFGPGETTKTFTITTSGVGFLGFYFTASGPDAGRYLVGGLGAGIPVRGKTVVLNAPAFMPRSTTSAPITVQLSAPAPEAMTITLQISTINAATVSPAVLEFAAGETSKTFTVTTGSSFHSMVEIILVPDNAGSQNFEQAPTTQITIESPVRLTSVATVTTTAVNAPVSVNLPYQLTVPVTIELTQSGSAGPVSVSRTSFTFSPGETALPFTIASFPKVGEITFTGTVSGPGAAFFPTVTPHTITVETNLGVSNTTPTSVVFGQSFATTLTVPAPLPEPVTVSMTLTGPGGAGSSFSPQTVTLPAGELSVPVTFTAGNSIGDVQVTYAFSGPGATFVRSRFRPLRVMGTVTFSGQPTSLGLGQTSQPITVTLSHAPLAPFTMSLNISPTTTGAFFTPASLQWGLNETTKTFTVTTGLTGTTLFVNASSPAASAFPNANFNFLLLNTPTGTNVTVTPSKPPAMVTPVTLTFGQVTTAGNTLLGTVSAAGTVPSGFEDPGTPSMPLRFGAVSQAVHTGPVLVCATYPDGIAADETALRIFRRGAGWVDETESIDAASNIICASVDSLTVFTAFGIFRPNAPPVVGAISGPAAVVSAGENTLFSATITDPNPADVHTGTWIWGDGTTSPATIATVNGVRTATNEHAFATGGTFAVALVVTDGATPVRSADFEVTVDGAAPVISTLTASPEFIWPPNQAMHAVVLTAVATDDTGTPVCTITSVAADGLAAGDYAITGPLTLMLKAWPNNRTYTITVTCTDAVGRTVTGTVTVDVGKEKKKDK